MQDLGPFYQDVIAVDPLEPYSPASAAYRLELLTPALPFRVSGARLVPVHQLYLPSLRHRPQRARSCFGTAGIEKAPGGAISIPALQDRC
jgi:hypothetical protein